MKEKAHALLKVVELGRLQVKQGKFKTLVSAFEELDEKIKQFKKERKFGDTNL